MSQHHPRPWWFVLALWLVPHRCREIPEANNPNRIVLRQVALWYRHVYLQNFASSEDQDWAHSHQWHHMLAIGLWGSYTEVRLAGPLRQRRAPYIYTLNASTIHQVRCPSPGHTSLFIGLWRNDDLKHYYNVTGIDLATGWTLKGGHFHEPLRKHWSAHVRELVARI